MQKKAEELRMVKMNLYAFALLLMVVLLAATATGQHYAYVTNAGEMGDGINGDLSIIDLATNMVVATVPLGDYPQGVAINPAGTAVYTANSGTNDFTMVDTVTLTSTTVPGGLIPVGIAVHPNGRHIYLANTDFFDVGQSTISVVDRATNTIVDEIVCGKGSITLTVAPDGKLAYVPNASGGSVAVVDTDTHEIVDTIALQPVGADEACVPVPIVVHPDGTFVYVANRQGPTLWAINTATHEYMARPYGRQHVGIAINPTGTVLYLPDFDSSDPNIPPQGEVVFVVDAQTLDLITTIDGLTAPLDVSVHPDGTRIYITNMMADTVAVVDAATHALIATVPVGSVPHGYGECVGPGVPHMLKADAVTRLRAVKATIAAGADGVVSPELAIEHITAAIEAGNFCVQDDLWSVDDAGQLDPRRLAALQSDSFVESGQAMVQAVLSTIRRGWITDAELRAELLAVVNEAVRAHRVLVAVAIDDAIMAGVDHDAMAQAQEVLQEGDALVKEASLGTELTRKASLLGDAISQYQNARQAALSAVE
jgi:YVTN family beta-propeller protein